MGYLYTGFLCITPYNNKKYLGNKQASEQIAPALCIPAPFDTADKVQELLAVANACYGIPEVWLALFYSFFS